MQEGVLSAYMHAQSEWSGVQRSTGFIKTAHLAY